MHDCKKLFGYLVYYLPHYDALKFLHLLLTLSTNIVNQILYMETAKSKNENSENFRKSHKVMSQRYLTKIQGMACA